MAAFFTGVEFGLQPLLFHAADGTPLYAPYPLSVAIPAMVLPHLLVASVVEGLLTALVVAYLQRSNLAVLEAAEKPALGGRGGQRRQAALGLAGAGAPGGHLAAGAAGARAPPGASGAPRSWPRMGLGAIPAGLHQLVGTCGARRWPDTTCPRWATPTWATSFRPLVGILVIGIVAWLFTMLLAHRRRRTRSENQ